MGLQWISYISTKSQRQIHLQSSPHTFEGLRASFPTQMWMSSFFKHITRRHTVIDLSFPKRSFSSARPATKRCAVFSFCTHVAASAMKLWVTITYGDHRPMPGCRVCAVCWDLGCSPAWRCVPLHSTATKTGFHGRTWRSMASLSFTASFSWLSKSAHSAFRTQSFLHERRFDHFVENNLKNGGVNTSDGAWENDRAWEWENEQIFWFYLLRDCGSKQRNPENLPVVNGREMMQNLIWSPWKLAPAVRSLWMNPSKKCRKKILWYLNVVLFAILAVTSFNPISPQLLPLSSQPFPGQHS